jgi:hypothetical protein
MAVDREEIKRKLIGFLIDWQRHKESHRVPEPNEPGRSPISQIVFAGRTWREYLPELSSGFAHGFGGYQYVQDYHPKQTQQFEKVISDVFQELEQQQIITVAAPYRHESLTMGFGLCAGGTPTHHYELTSRAAAFAGLDMEGFLAVLNLPKGHEHLADQVQSFIRAHGAYDTNVFLMMPFGTDAELSACRASLTRCLSSKGFNLFRADDREYEDGLWENIRVYMLGCKYGIAMFKQVSGIGYNPNVGVEIGFMDAMNKRILILKDRHLLRLPGDLIYRLYHQVDFADVPSVEREVAKWFDGLA